jgi:hypothetical protein
MKKILIVLTTIFLLSSVSVAQNSSTPEKPWWAKSAFYKDLEGSYLKTFTTNGITQEDARNSAEKIVIKERESTIGKNIGADNSAFKASYRIIYEHFEQNKDFYVGYFLYQICYSYECDFKKDIQPFMEEVVKRNKEKQKMQSDNFFLKKRDKYIAIHLLDVSYPFSLGVGFSGRHGGKVGFGYEVLVGWGTNFTLATLSYSGKLRFYCYKNLFIQSGFGTLGIKTLDSKISGLVDDYNNNDYDNYYNYQNHNKEIYETAVNYTKAHSYIMYGIPIQVGYDFITNGGFYASVRGGCGYDIVGKTVVPLFNVAIGVKINL